MNYKPLPTLGGTIEDRIKRCAKSQSVLAKSEEYQKQLDAEKERESGKLTPKQIMAWRHMLALDIGAVAYSISDSMIQLFRDKIQEGIDKYKP